MRNHSAPAAALFAASLLSGCAADSWFWFPFNLLIPAEQQGPAPIPPPPGARALKLTLGEDGPVAYATLVHEQGVRRLWRTPGGLAIATDGARIVATAGLEQVLAATRIEGADPLGDPRTLLGRDGVARRLVDLATAARDPREMRFGLDVECRLHAEAAAVRPEEPDAEAVQDEPERLPQPAPVRLLRILETCRGAPPIESFTNTFEVRAADGAVLRSEQWIGPELPLLSVEAVPPPA